MSREINGFEKPWNRTSLTQLKFAYILLFLAHSTLAVTFIKDVIGNFENVLFPSTSNGGFAGAQLSLSISLILTAILDYITIVFPLFLSSTVDISAIVIYTMVSVTTVSPLLAEALVLFAEHIAHIPPPSLIASKYLPFGLPEVRYTLVFIISTFVMILIFLITAIGILFQSRNGRERLQKVKRITGSYLTPFSLLFEGLTNILIQNAITVNLLLRSALGKLKGLSFKPVTLTAITMLIVTYFLLPAYHIVYTILSVFIIMPILSMIIATLVTTLLRFFTNRNSVVKLASFLVVLFIYEYTLHALSYTLLQIPGEPPSPLAAIIFTLLKSFLTLFTNMIMSMPLALVLFSMIEAIVHGNDIHRLYTGRVILPRSYFLFLLVFLIPLLLVAVNAAIFYSLGLKGPISTEYLILIVMSIWSLLLSSTLIMFITIYAMKLDDEIMMVDSTIWFPALALPFGCPLEEGCMIKVVTLPLIVFFILFIFALLVIYGMNVLVEEVKGLTSASINVGATEVGIVNFVTSILLPLSLPFIIYYFGRLMESSMNPCTTMKDAFKEMVKSLHLRMRNYVAVLGQGLMARILIHKITVRSTHSKKLDMETLPFFISLRETPTSSHTGDQAHYYQECTIDFLPTVASVVAVDNNDLKHYWCGTEALRDNFSYCVSMIEPSDTLVAAPSPSVLHLSKLAEGSGECCERKAKSVVSHYLEDLHIASFLYLSLRGDATHDFLLSLLRLPEGILISMIPDPEKNSKIERRLINIRAGPKALPKTLAKTLMSSKETTHLAYVWMEASDSDRLKVIEGRLMAMFRAVKRPVRRVITTSTRYTTPTLVDLDVNFEHMLAASVVSETYLLEFIR